MTIAEALKAGGYKTASIGKWHLGSTENGHGAKSQGFDIDLGGLATGATDTHWWPYGLPGLDEGGKDGEYLTDRMTDEAMTFMDRNKGKPWFIFLSYYAVHMPLQVRAKGFRNCFTDCIAGTRADDGKVCIQGKSRPSTQTQGLCWHDRER